MDDGFTGSEYLIHYRAFKAPKGPLLEDLAVSLVGCPGPRPRQTASTAVRTWHNFEPLRSFKDKREARTFLERFFHENLPVEASASFKREMEVAMATIVGRI